MGDKTSSEFGSGIMTMNSDGSCSIMVQLLCTVNGQVSPTEIPARRVHPSGNGCFANAQGVCAESSCMEALKLNAADAAFWVAYETSYSGSSLDATVAAASAAYARALESISDVEGLDAAIAAQARSGHDCGVLAAKREAHTAARNAARVAQDRLEDGGTTAVSVLHTSVDD
jgi:hypothetical protein